MRNRRKAVHKKRVVFPVHNVPPLGWKVVTLRPELTTEATTHDLHIGGDVIGNEFLTVQAEAFGALKVEDKRTGVVYEKQNVFEDQGDIGDEYTFCPVPGGNVSSLESVSATEIVDRRPLWVSLKTRLVLQAPVAASVDRRGRSKQTVALSLESEVRLVAGVPRVEITTRVENRVKDHRLRVLFPLGRSIGSSWAEAAYAAVERPIRPPEGEGWVERPVATYAQQRFVVAQGSEGGPGLAVLNKGLPEYEATPDGVVKVTLIRGVGWLSREDLATRPGHAGPPVETPEAQCLGAHVFEYALVPFSGSWREAEIWRQADEYCLPMTACRIRRTTGELDPVSCGVRVLGEGLVLTAVKKAEEGDAVIVRFFNSLGKETDAVVETGRAVRRAMHVDLNEANGETVSLETDRRLRITVAAHRIVTLKLEPG
jgi:alpha-mannosidase